jgi:hypothetical protein
MLATLTLNTFSSTLASLFCEIYVGSTKSMGPTFKVARPTGMSPNFIDIQFGNKTIFI